MLLAAEKPRVESAPVLRGNPPRIEAAYSDSPVEFANQLRSDQPERWRSFHGTNPNILVIDDNPRTCDRIARGLQELYGKNVDQKSSPERALQYIRGRKANGWPYDLIVVDLHMPTLPGLQLLKELGKDCPAVVINTGSMMAPALADLKIQMDNFSAERVNALVAEHVAERAPLGAPLAPFFVHTKDQSWKNLIDKIDSALLLQQQIPDGALANERFLEFFKPKLVPVTFSALTVHNLVAELQNAVAEIAPAIGELRDSRDAAAVSWWQSSGQALAESIQILKSAHFSRILSENPALTWQAVHDLAGEFKNLSPQGVTFPESSSAHLHLERWRDGYERYDALITEITNGMRSYVHDEVNLRSIVEISALNHGIMLLDLDDFEREKEPTVSDSDKLVRNLIASACAEFAKTALQHPESRLTINFTAERDRLGEPIEITRTLKPLQCGSYFEILFLDYTGRPFDQTFASLARALPQLREAGLANFRVDTSDAEPSRFSLFVKARNATVDFQEYRREAQAASENFDHQFESLGPARNVKVYKDRGLEGKITCLGELPQRMDLNSVDAVRSHEAGIVYHTNSKTYVATAPSHKEASGIISAYLKAETAASDSVQSPSTNEVLRDGVRLSTFSTKGIQIEPEQDKSERAKDALIQLGLLPERATISGRYFQAPKALKVEKTKPRPFMGQWFNPGEIPGDFEQLFKISENRTGAATMQAYREILTGPGIDEPSFVIRSRAGLTKEQQKAACELLLPALKALHLNAWECSEWNDSVQIDGDVPRKSGLFLFDPTHRGREEDSGSCRFSHRLKPLISRSAPYRLGEDGIAIVDRAPLPKDSLVFGGGDHSLYGCKDQWGLALAIELTLQKLRIPYESCRGELRENSSYARFDGQTLSAVSEDLPAPFVLREYVEF